MSAFKEKQKVHLALYMCEECKKGRFLFFIEDIFFNSPITTYSLTSLLT